MSAIGTHTITLGDTLLPLNAILRDGNGNPIDLASYTVKFELETEGGTEELAATTTGVTKHPTQTFTVDTSEDTVKCVAHGAIDDDHIVLANSGGALPTSSPSVAAGTEYFARDITPNTFRLSVYPQSAKIDFTGAGTGTHTFYVKGSAQFDFSSTNVDEAKRLRGWWVLESSSETKRIPEGDHWIAVNVVNKGA